MNGYGGCRGDAIALPTPGGGGGGVNGREGGFTSRSYGPSGGSVNENTAACRVITGQERLFVCDAGERESGRVRDGGARLYNVAKPVPVVLGRSHCDISGLTDVLIRGGGLFKYGKSGIL